MRASHLFFGLLLVGVIVAGSYSVLDDAVSDSGFGGDAVVNDNYSSSFDKTLNVSAEISSDYSNMINWTVDKTSFLALIPNAASMAKNMIKLPFSTIGELIGILMGHLGLPPWAQSFLLAAVCGFAVFAIISLILRYKYV